MPPDPRALDPGASISLPPPPPPPGSADEAEAQMYAAQQAELQARRRAAMTHAPNAASVAAGESMRQAAAQEAELQAAAAQSDAAVAALAPPAPAAPPPGGAEPASPLAGLTPEQLMAPVVVGRTSTGNTSITPGVKMMPGYMEELDRSAQAQGAALQAQGKAQEAASRERSFVLLSHQAQVEFEQARHQAARAKHLAKVEEFDAEAAKIRAEVRAAKVEPDRLWSGAGGIARRIAFALAAGLEGFGKGLRGEGGPNNTIALMLQLVDRDVALQRESIERRKGDLADVRGAMADVYRRVGDLDQAAQQTRLLLNESLQARLARIAATWEGPQIAARTAQGIEALKAQATQAKAQAYAAAQDRVTKSFSSTTQTAPLASVLGQQAGKTKPPKDASDPLVDRVSGTVSALDDIREASGQMQRAGYGMVDRRIPNTEANRLRELYIGPLLVRLHKSIEPGILTEDDYKRARKLLDADFSTPKEIFLRLAVVSRQLTRRTYNDIRAYGASNRDVSGLVEMISPYINAPLGTQLPQQQAGR